MQVSNKTFNLQQNFAPQTPPPEIRPIAQFARLLGKWLPHSPPQRQQKKRSPYRTSLLVPYDVLFSNEFLRDLGRIWSLRDIVPDPNNLWVGCFKWVERSQQVWAERREAITIIDCLGLTDDGWKFIFKDNYQSKTKDCDSNNRRPKTTLPHRHRLTAPGEG